MEKSIDQLFPIMEVSDHQILSKSGNLTIALQLTKPEVFTLSARELAVLHEAYVRGISQLSPGTILHFQDRFYMDRFKPEIEDDDRSWATKASDRHFAGRPFLKHEAYLFITRRTQAKDPGPAMSSLLRRHLVPQQLLGQTIRRELDDQAAQLERTLIDTGLISCRRLTTEELAGDESTTGIIEQYCMLSGGGSPGPHPNIIRDISFSNGIRIGELHGVLYTMADATHLPPHCSPSIRYAPLSTERTSVETGFTTALGPLMQRDHMYNQYLFIEEPDTILRDLELKKRRLRSLSAQSRENGLTQQAIDKHLDETIGAQKRTIRAHFNVFTWTADPAQLPELRKDISAAISSTGVTPYAEPFSEAQIWWAGIPGNAGDLPVNDRFTTHPEPAACFLLQESPARSAAAFHPIRLGDRVTGAPLDVDISYTPYNKNWIGNFGKFVLGGSGSGKSFFLNHMLRAYLEKHAIVLVIDIGNSYQGLCKMMNGQYYTYEKTQSLSFNPFITDVRGMPSATKLESLKTLLIALWKKEDDAFLRSEYVGLSDAIAQYYQRLTKNERIRPCFDTFYEYLRDEFAPAFAKKGLQRSDFDIDNFIYVLSPYYAGGSYDYLLNAQKHVDPGEQSFFVFEIDAIANHEVLLPVVLIIIIELFTTIMTERPYATKLLLVEEAWKALARQGMSEYIRYSYKTFRKFNGHPIVATQELDDILSSPIVKQAIINNSDCKIILDVSKFQHRFDELQQVLNLSEKDKALVLSLNRNNDKKARYKEVFISLGDGHSQVYRTEVSPEEYWSYTTDATEKALVARHAEGRSWQEAVQRAIAEWEETQKQKSK